MGELFRRYWLPALLAEELPEPDCPPVRVKLLSERLMAFRDTEGRYGLIDEFCAHRGVSLWFGRNEECGLRCPYHGWKYDVTGQCIEVPSEPEESGFCEEDQAEELSADRARRRAVDVHGAARTSRRRPSTSSPTFRPSRRFISKRLQECNWLQAMEGGIDSSHVSFLHRGSLELRPAVQGREGQRVQPARLEAEVRGGRKAGGLLIGARRNAEDGHYYWRMTQWVMPFFTMIPPRGDHSVHGHFWVPIDDENCWTWSFDYHPMRALTPEEVQAMRDGKGMHVRYVPGTFRPLRTRTTTT